MRNSPGDAVRRLRGLFGHEPLAVGDIVLLELLQGARDEAHATRLDSSLRQFDLVSMLNDAIAVAAAGHFRRLRTRGITMRKTVDLVIGTWCIEHDIALLHATAISSRCSGILA